MKGFLKGAVKSLAIKGKISNIILWTLFGWDYEVVQTSPVLWSILRFDTCEVYGFAVL